MAYSVWSVIAGEQPTTAKWNILGTNDAAFNNGTGFAAGALGAGGIANFASGLTLPTVTQNPYKFFAYRNSAWTYTSGIVKVPYDTKLYDTSSNFDAVTNNRFTAPVAGFYRFSCWTVNSGASGSFTGVSYLYKNGTAYIGSNDNLTGKGWGFSPPLVQLAANDYIEIFVNLSVGTQTMGVGSAPLFTWFGGYLDSAT